MGKTVAITGVNSYFAGTLLPRLDRDPEIDRIIGIDVAPWKGTAKKVTFCREDIRSPKIAGLLKGVDAVYHLAFIVGEIADKEKTRDININGSKNLFSACLQNGVKKVIYTSSMTIYGSHPFQPLGLTEESPLIENQDSYYNSNKIAVESFVKDFFKPYPGITLTIFRAGLLCGPHINNMFSRLWSLKVSSLPAGRQSYNQFIHEEDLGEALHLALKKDIPGVYNVTADDAIPTAWCFRAAGVRIVPLPTPLLKVVSRAGFALGLFPAGQGWVTLGEYTIFGLNQKFKDATGWRPKYSSEQTFRSFLAARAERAEKNTAKQSLLTWFYRTPAASKRGLQGIEGLIALVSKVPGLRMAWPWLSPRKNSITYLPTSRKIEPIAPMTIKVGKDVGSTSNEILPENILHELIDRAQHHLIMDECICRTAFKCEHFTKDVGCIFMGETAMSFPPGLGRIATKEEAHRHVDRAVSLGLLPLAGKVNVDNTGFLVPYRKKLLSVCFCCHCCCMMGYFRHASPDHLRRIFPPVEGMSVTVTEKCKGCGTCVETCVFDAITLKDGRAVHSEKCRACGRCVNACPNGAVRITISNPNYKEDVLRRIGSFVDLS
jgi:UDP-glucose 4-epimerase